MSPEAVKTAELLSAYLSGDVAAGERSVVERWLAGDPAAREQLDDLREFVGFLGDGLREASPEALEKLRRAVQQKIREKRDKEHAPSHAPVVAELLGAYLSGDVTPDERADVVRWLAGDRAAREQLDDLRKFCVLLKAGEAEAAPAALDSLRDAVKQKIQDLRIKELVTTSVTGDLTNAEKNEVETYVNAHPPAQKELRQAAAMAVLLNAGQSVAGDALADRLRANLKNALPTGAIAPKASDVRAPLAPRMIRDTAAPAQAEASSAGAQMQARPSLRVFVKPDNPWKKRWMVAVAGLAALIAFSVVARVVWLRNSVGHEVVKLPNPTEPSVPKTNGLPEPIQASNGENGTGIAKKDGDSISANPRNVVPPNAPNVANETPNNTPVAPPHAPPQPDNTPAPDVVKNNVNDNKALVPNPGTIQDTNVVAPPKDAVVQNPNPGATPNNPNVPAPNTPNPTPNNPAVANNSNNGNTANGVNPVQGGVAAIGTGSTTSVVPPSSPTPTQPVTPPIVPTSNNGTVTPQNGVGVTGTTKGSGVVQVTLNGEVTTLSKTGDIVPSGATLVTGNVRVSLVLPGNGRLYIQPYSNMTLIFSQLNTSINLTTGEIYYIAPPGGTLALIAQKASATQVTEADTSLSGGKLTAANFNDNSLVLSGKSPKLRVGNNAEGSVAIDGSAAPKFDVPVTLNGYWRFDVAVPGDGIGKDGNGTTKVLIQNSAYQIKK